MIYALYSKDSVSLLYFRILFTTAYFAAHLVWLPFLQISEKLKPYFFKCQVGANSSPLGLLHFKHFVTKGVGLGPTPRSALGIG